MHFVTEFLQPDAVLDNVVVSGKKALLQLIAKEAGRRLGLDATIVADAINSREKLGSTGFGNGAAIPHGRIEGLPGVFGMFVRLTQPIAYDSVDGMAVDLVFVLLSPKQSSVAHLKALAQISRMLRDRGLLAALRGAMSVDALYALFVNHDSRSAA